MKKVRKDFSEQLENSPLISIILPTFNREKTVVKAIHSILEQTYTNFELIIVDDHSTDQTKGVIRKLKDKRILLVCNETNRGPSISRNIGVTYATSNILAFHDSDDIWHKDKLEKQIEYWKNKSESIMVYSRYLYNTDERTFEIPEHSLEREYLEGDIFLSLLSGNKVGTPTMLMRKEYFEKVGGFDSELKALEDWDLAIKIAREGKIGFVDECLVTAYGKEEGVNSNIENLIDAQIAIIKNYCSNEENLHSLEPSILFLMERIAKNISRTNCEKYKSLIIPNIISNQLDYHLIINALKKKAKMEENYHLMVKMNDIKVSANRLETYFDAQGWKTMAIYGFGKVGSVFHTIVQQTKLDLLYLIDREKIQVDSLQVRRYEEIDSVPDVIIVTTPMGYNEIRENLSKYTRSNIRYIREVLM